MLSFAGPAASARLALAVLDLPLPLDVAVRSTGPAPSARLALAAFDLPLPLDEEVRSMISVGGIVTVSVYSGIVTVS